MYSWFVRWIVALVLIAMSATTAGASSDIGYTLRRGKIAVTVRFNMMGLFEAKEGKDQAEKVAYAEVSETGRSFFDLVKWFYINDKELRKYDIYIVINVSPNNGFDIGYYGSEKSDYVDVASVTYTRGKLVHSMTIEIDKLLKITTQKNIQDIDRSLYVIYFSPKDTGDLAPDHIPNCGIYMGAFPGNGTWRKIDGEYKVAGICWDDDPGVFNYQLRNGETMTRIPLQRDAVQKALRSIE